MRRLIAALITTAAAVGFSCAASAADLPVKAPVQQAAPAILYNWNGWYVGANAGYSWGTSAIDYTQDPGSTFLVPPFGAGGAVSSSVSPKSFIGGGQLGFNYQTGVWVFGIETDLAWRNRTDSASFTSSLNPFGDTLTLSDEQNWVGTLRGRIGLTPASMSNWLFYVTGGLAYGDFEHSVTQFCNNFCAQTRTFSDSVTKAGWTLGGGVEVALTRNWSLGAEYLYMDFGTDTLSAAGAGAPPPPNPGTSFPGTTASFHDKSQVARLKLNYRFGDVGLY
jgi:outer membrane immunogenic protein